MKSVRHTDRGVVLATVVLLLLAVTLVAHASLVVSRAYRQGGLEFWEAVRVRRAVGGRVDLAVVTHDSVSRGWRASGPGVETRLESVLLSPEVSLLAAGGRSAAARWWAGRVTWHADPYTRGATIGAAVRLGGRLTISADAASLTTTAGGTCAADQAPRLALALGPSGVGVGPLDAAALASRLDPWVDSVPPAPCPAGGCPARLAVAPGPLTLSGGVFSGVLLVRGNLTLTDSARVAGLILVEGSLTLRNSARIDGAVRVLHDVIIDPTGSIHGDPCLVSRLWASGLGERLGTVPLDRRPWALWGPPS